MMFTEEIKEQAIAFETIVGHTLAKHFLEEIRNEQEPSIEELSKLSLEEQLKMLGEGLKRVQESEKKAKLLNDIRDGKYRLMFMALVVGMKEFAKGAVANLSPEEVEENMDKFREFLEGGAENGED